VPEFKTVLKVLAKWLPEILAFHREGRITNGRLEGQNNKLGVLKRIAYGFVNPDNFGARALLGALPCHHDGASVEASTLEIAGNLFHAQQLTIDSVHPCRRFVNRKPLLDEAAASLSHSSSQ